MQDENFRFLVLKLLCGRNLVAKDSNGFSDPYCKFKFNDVKFISGVKTKTLNPIWNESFLIGHFAVEQTLEVVCMDKDLIKADDFLGQANISLKDFFEPKEYEPQWFPLVGRGKKDESISGELLIQLCIEPFHKDKLYQLPKESVANFHKLSKYNLDGLAKRHDSSVFNSFRNSFRRSIRGSKIKERSSLNLDGDNPLIFEEPKERKGSRIKGKNKERASLDLNSENPTTPTEPPRSPSFFRSSRHSKSPNQSPLGRRRKDKSSSPSGSMLHKSSSPPRSPIVKEPPSPAQQTSPEESKVLEDKILISSHEQEKQSPLKDNRTNGANGVNSGILSVSESVSPISHLSQFSTPIPRSPMQKMLNPGKLDEDYLIGRVLGKGAFGEVKQVTHKKTGEERAVKFIAKEGDQIFSTEYIRSTTENEINILCSVTSPNVINIKDLYITDVHYCIVLELVTGGDLLEHICANSISEQEASRAIHQVLLGVYALHRNGIIHRDIKPENILLSSRNPGAIIKMADFGLASKIGTQESSRCYESMGTPMYLAPEIILTQRAQKNGTKIDGYGLKADIWAIGVITYTLLCGFPPFYDEAVQSMFDDILKGLPEEAFAHTEWETISEAAKDFVRSLLCVDESKRLSAFQALTHRWISGSENDNVLNSTTLQHTARNLRKFNAKRKFRSVVFATMATQRVARGLTSPSFLRKQPTSTPTPSPPPSPIL